MGQVPPSTPNVTVAEEKTTPSDASPAVVSADISECAAPPLAATSTDGCTGLPESSPSGSAPAITVVVEEENTALMCAVVEDQLTSSAALLEAGEQEKHVEETEARASTANVPKEDEDDDDADKKWARYTQEVEEQFKKLARDRPDASEWANLRYADVEFLQYLERLANHPDFPLTALASWNEQNQRWILISYYFGHASLVSDLLNYSTVRHPPWDVLGIQTNGSNTLGLVADELWTDWFSELTDDDA